MLTMRLLRAPLIVTLFASTLASQAADVYPLRSFATLVADWSCTAGYQVRLIEPEHRDAGAWPAPTR